MITMQKKAMGLLWRFNNWIDNKAIHIRAWLRWRRVGRDMDNDIIIRAWFRWWDVIRMRRNDIVAKMWKEKHG